MRFEYNEAQEAKLRVTEIQAILENEELAPVEEQALVAERSALEKMLEKAGYAMYTPSHCPADDDMTRDGIFQTIRRRLNEHIGSGEAGTWDDINARIQLLPPYPRGHILAVWGNRTDNGRDHYTVYLLRSDADDTEEGVLEVTATYDCADEELKAAVNRVLDHFKSTTWEDADTLQAWAALEDVPVNGDSECLEQDFLWFPIGTSKQELWSWFFMDEKPDFITYEEIKGFEETMSKSLLFSEVTLTSGSYEESFLVGGIPRDADDLTDSSGYADFMCEVEDGAEVSVHVEAYLFGDGEAQAASHEELCQIVDIMRLTPDLLGTRCDNIEDLDFSFVSH